MALRVWVRDVLAAPLLPLSVYTPILKAQGHAALVHIAVKGNKLLL
jgi:hypothetical protein